MKVGISKDEFDICFQCCTDTDDFGKQPIIIATSTNHSTIRMCVPCFQKLCRGVKKHALSILVQTGINVRKDI